MPSTYKTPGVYVEEITKFPPSVAAVETAIPAFIGYTRKANFRGENLENRPVRIASMVEYVEKFGGAPDIKVNNVALDVDNSVLSSSLDSKYYLYDSLRLFYANGGGDCYIISVGLFPDTVQLVKLENGLENVLVKADEPTLIVFPDGILLGKDQLASLYQKALMQCEDLKDRFCIMDVHISNPDDQSMNYDTDITDFRTRIGSKNLKYGAAYYPYCKVNIPREVNYRDIYKKVFKLGSEVDWKSSDFVDPSDTDTIDLVDELNDIVISLSLHMEPDMRAFLPSPGVTLPPDVQVRSLEDIFLVLYQDFKSKAAIPAANATTVGNLRTSYKAIIEFLYQVAHTFFEKYANTSSDLEGDVLSSWRTAVDGLFTTVDRLIKIDNSSQNKTTSTASEFPLFDDGGSRTWVYGNAASPGGTGAGTWEAFFANTNSDDTLFPAGNSNNAERKENMIHVVSVMSDNLKDIFYQFYTVINNFYENVQEDERQKQNSLLLQIPVVKNVIDKLSIERFILPASGGIAGVYSSVDASRGVWKAPANVSMNSVIGPTVLLTRNDQNRLNVDVSFGKSINAIRQFTGKGTMVWGARTLSGNDNEWRYVPVRRFFNFAEESIKKATESFVFEPNDANTWVRVRAMIENFLTLQWRAGALAGAKPEHAFYVKIGLGETMTSIDILEGRMIVEIGMAVVRPAEFIILRFSHKMQES